MKKINYFLFFILLAANIFAQNKPQMNVKTNDNKTTQFNLEDITDITFSTKQFQTFYDGFDVNISNWTLYGSPLPLYVASIYSRSGIFDNKGDASYGSGGISKTLVGNGTEMTIETEVYIDVTNSSGCWVGAAVGLSKTQNPTPTSYDAEWGLSFSLDYSGSACWGDSVIYQKHGWFGIGLFAEDGSSEYPNWNRAPFLNADSQMNGWHVLKIEIASDRYVSFYCDNNLVWKSTKRINQDIITNKNVLLGWRSSGSAGKAYHDWVKVLY